MALHNDDAPLIPRERVLVGAAGDVDDDFAAAREFGLGVEVQHFSMPPFLGRDWRPEAERILPILQTLRGRMGLHGAFIDTVHTSPDPGVRALTKDRYIESFELAAFLGARFVVIHSQFNTALRLPEYARSYHAASLAFWPEVIEEAMERGLTIYMENMFDTDPGPIAGVVAAINHPALRVCLDVAHVEIFSALPLTSWIDALGPYIGHVHINDCDGVLDQHLALGDGVLPLRDAIERIESVGLAPTYTLETHTGARASAAFLGFDPL